MHLLFLCQYNIKKICIVKQTTSISSLMDSSRQETASTLRDLKTEQLSQIAGAQANQVNFLTQSSMLWNLFYQSFFSVKEARISLYGSSAAISSLREKMVKNLISVVKTANYILNIDCPHLQEEESQECTQLIKAGSELPIQVRTAFSKQLIMQTISFLSQKQQEEVFQIKKKKNLTKIFYT